MGAAGEGFAGAGFDAVGAGGAPLAAAPDTVAPPSPAMIAATAPTGATSPACAPISASVPVVIDGTSIETLSVSISNRLSPGSTAAPGATNHLVILPSATVSPSCGISTSISNPLSLKKLLDPFPGDFLRRVRRPQDQPV